MAQFLNNNPREKEHSRALNIIQWSDPTHHVKALSANKKGGTRANTSQ